MHRSPARAEVGPLTLEDFERLPEGGDNRLEPSRGLLVREPQPEARRGAVVVNVLRALDSFARRRALDRVVVEAGFLLADDPPTVRRPDAAFVSFERWPAGSVPEGFWPFAVDLAVEVVSPSNAAADMQEKVLQYLEAGASVVWVVQPRTRTVEIWRPGTDVRVLHKGDSLEGGNVLPGFRLTVREMLAVWCPCGNRH